MIKLDDQTIQVVIEDNGVGRTKAEEMKSKQSLKKKSFGSQISKDRIKYFSELTGKVAELKIEDLYHEDGTTKTNLSGGIQGGISNGEDIYFRVAFKPVATIMQKQETITF